MRFELGPEELRLLTPRGERFRTYVELVAEAETLERRRDELERDRERGRAERLAARLRELGIEPEE